MANTIGANFNPYLKMAGQFGKQKAGGAGKGNQTSDIKDLFAKFGSSSNVEFSSEGLAALAKQKEAEESAIGEKGTEKTADGKELSPKAQAYLENLRKKYGDYDFVVADNVDDPQSLTAGSTKTYSVILSSDELEKMADDEEYADKIMGKVDSAVDMTKRIEESGELGEGVHFKSIAISFDEDGNTKMFAELEKMSAEQQERLEKAKEKRAEEKKEAEGKAEKDKDKQVDTSPVKRAKVEAASEEELLEKILGIDWDKIEAE